MLRKLLVAGALSLVVFGGVTFLARRAAGGPDPWQDCTMPRVAPAAEAPDEGPAFDLRWEPVAAIEGALALAAPPGAERPLYVASQSGLVHRIDGGDPPTVVLDLTSEVSTTFEQGLLGLAIDPLGEHLVVSYTDHDDDSHVVEYVLENGAPDPASVRTILFLEQPFHTHNGGHVTFTTDGSLWIGFGDGKSGKAPGIGNGPAAQDPTDLFGSILRIDPDDPAAAYGIPAGNPFVDHPTARPEIWAFGLRNPWRFAIDEPTGDVWIGDVGQHCHEEIDHLPGGGAGANLGWDLTEGPDRYREGDTSGTTFPIHVLEHRDGACSVVGGVVYRGRLLSDELDGWYLFADSCTGRIEALRHVGDGSYELRDTGVMVRQIVAFGVDGTGEVYALSLVEGVGRLVSGTTVSGTPGGQASP